MNAKILPLRNGPLKVEGDFQIVDSAGKVFPVAADKPVFLCRCGLSGRKPFCDGTHGSKGFTSEVSAPDPQ